MRKPPGKLIDLLGPEVRAQLEREYQAGRERDVQETLARQAKRAAEAAARDALPDFTVGRLRELLAKLPPGLDGMSIVLEGCDCEGVCFDAFETTDSYTGKAVLYMERRR